MARRKAAAEETTVETNEVETPTEENTVSETTEAVEATETTEVEIDLTEFEAALDAGAESADGETGVPSEDAVAELNKAYQAIPSVRGKNKARQLIDDKMKHALTEENDFIKTKAFVNLRERLVAGSSSSTKAPADPTAAFVQKVASIVLAKDLVQTDVPEGVSEDWADRVSKALDEAKSQLDSYREWEASEAEDKGDSPAGPVLRQALKLVTVGGRGTGVRTPFTGVRRNIVTHMEQVFAEVESGTFLKVSEIAKAKTEEYGDDTPSAGAVSSRLFPKGKEPFEGDTFKATEQDGNKGAIKL